MNEDLYAARVDAVAQHLRAAMQGHKLLTPWDSTPKAKKKKWRDLAIDLLAVADAIIPVEAR